MSAPPPDAADRSPMRWVLCGLLLLATTLNYMDRVALNQTINTIRDEFSLTDKDYGRLESAFAVAFGLGTLVTGWVVDRISVRWVYPVVVACWSAAGFATGFATNFAELMACRVALGLFEAGNWPCGVRTTRSLPPDERPLGNALFQSGTGIGAIVTPVIVLAFYRYYGADTPGVWRVPFQAIGLIGLGWVVVWVGVQFVRPLPPPPAAAGPGGSFLDVLTDRRFWILVGVIVGVNAGWHTLRIWSPRFLKEVHGFGAEDVQYFGIGYYVAADVGSWTVGLLVLAFARGGFDLGRVRLAAYAVCTLLVLSAAFVPLWSRGPLLTANLYLVGFGALGLFPLYFALSQTLSARHQGKVTGTLGCINALVLAGMAEVQGRVASTDLAPAVRYGGLIALAGVPALVSLGLLLAFWQRGAEGSATMKSQ